MIIIGSHIAIIAFILLVVGILLWRSHILHGNEKSAMEPSAADKLHAAGRQLDQHVRQKVLSHFHQHFVNPDQLLWQVESVGIMAKFYENNIPQFVYYTPKGDWYYTLLRHEGRVLPDHLISLVDARFSGTSILRTEEIITCDSIGKTYILHIREKDLYKEVVIENDEIIIFSENKI